MPNYMLLLHEQPSDFSGLSPEAIEAVINEYVAWSAKLASENRLVGGEKLRDEGGKHLHGFGGEFRVTDGPYTEAKEIVGGFYTIAASDYNEAAEVGSGCPHLKYGGWIELREIEQMS